MKATFPHLGNAYIAIKGFLEDLDVEVIVPPPCNKKTLEIGVKNCPETACLPLKVNIGNYVQSLELGADTIIIAGSCGPCRFGYYGLLEKEILADMGYHADMIVLDPPKEGYKSFIKKCGKVTNGKPLVKVIKALKNGYSIAKKIDHAEKTMYYIKPREVNKGETAKIYREFIKKVNNTYGSKNILSLIDELMQSFAKVEIKQNIRPLKIGIIGEIYTVIEPFVNLHIEDKLGSLGVETERSMTVSGWLKTNLFAKALRLNAEKEIEKAAEPYLSLPIGGHAVQCLGNAVMYSRRNFDGVIQLLPFSCMPEIVVKSILPQLSTNENLPCMTLIVDELTGESGYMTRLEAFVDMLERKREVYN